MRFPFCGASYSSQSPFVDHQRTVNFVPEVVESGTGTGRVVLYPTPGFSTFANLATTPIRGMLSSNGRLFVVAGTTFYEVLSNGTSYAYGTVANDTLPATISSNGDAGHQLWITSGGSGYIFDLLTNAFSAAVRTDANFGAFLDGYFISLDTSESKFYISALENGLTWDETDVAQRSTTPDRWVSMAVSHGRIYLFGRQRTDIWYNSGASPFPFVPDQSAGAIEIGIAAAHSATILDNTIFFLGESEQGSGIVWRFDGYTPVRISNHAVEYAIQGYTTISDAVAFAYQDSGHAYYVLSFPTAGATWVYDCATNLWHERAHWNQEAETWSVWAPRFHAYAFGKHLVGDGASEKLWEMSRAYHTDADGTPIRRMRQAPHLINDHRYLFFHSAELLLEPGIGTVSIVEPQVGLQWSDDSGHTWSAIRWVSAGVAGAYKTRVIWRRLGRARDRIFRVVVEDGVPWRLIDLIPQIEPGLH